MSAWVRVAVAAALLAALTGCDGRGTRVSLAGDAHSSADARQRVTALLNRVYVPGAVRSTPSAVLRLPSVRESQVQAQRTFTVLGRAETIIAALEARPPAGLETVAPPYQSTATSAPLSTVVAQLRPVGRRQSELQTVSVAATDLGAGRVAIDVQAAVGWVGNRTAVETIPADVTDVQLALGRGDQPDEAMNRSNQLTDVQVHELAGVLNALPAVSRDQRKPCTETAIALAQLNLSYGGHHAVFDLQVGGCDEVDVTVDGVPQPLLGWDQAVTQEVGQILNMTLPPT